MVASDNELNLVSEAAETGSQNTGRKPVKGSDAGSGFLRLATIASCAIAKMQFCTIRESRKRRLSLSPSCLLNRALSRIYSETRPSREQLSNLKSRNREAPSSNPDRQFPPLSSPCTRRKIAGRPRAREVS